MEILIGILIAVAVIAGVSVGIAYNSKKNPAATPSVATAIAEAPAKVVRLIRAEKTPKAVRLIQHRLVKHPNKYGTKAKLAAIRKLNKAGLSRLYRYRAEVLHALSVAAVDPANGKDVRQAILDSKAALAA